MRLMNYVVVNVTKNEKIMTTLNRAKAEEALRNAQNSNPSDTIKMGYKFGNL